MTPIKVGIYEVEPVADVEFEDAPPGAYFVHLNGVVVKRRCLTAGGDVYWSNWCVDLPMAIRHAAALSGVSD